MAEELRRAELLGEAERADSERRKFKRFVQFSVGFECSHDIDLSGSVVDPLNMHSSNPIASSTFHYVKDLFSHYRERLLQTEALTHLRPCDMVTGSGTNPVSLMCRKPMKPCAIPKLATCEAQRPINPELNPKRSIMAEKLDVLFRKRMGEITAVFPSECGVNEYDMTCYAHVGQHGSCGLAWYNTTRKAKPAEYADLLAELRCIYAPEYQLVVKSRMTRKHFQSRRDQMRRAA